MKLHILTPHESRIRSIDFEVQRSRSWRMVNCILFPNYKLCNQPMIMNFVHLLQMNQGCALLILMSKGQRSRSWRIINCKWFLDYNWFCYQPMITKLHTHAPHESRMCSFDFEVKCQGHGAMMIENGFQTITDPVIHLWSWNFIHLLPMCQECDLLILGQKLKVKVMGH